MLLVYDLLTLSDLLWYETHLRVQKAPQKEPMNVPCSARAKRAMNNYGTNAHALAGPTACINHAGDHYKANEANVRRDVTLEE